MGWTSLSNRARRKLLKPFFGSYKTFKNRFFRTRQPAVSITVNRKDLEAWERAFITELEGLPILLSAEIIKGTGYSTPALKKLRKIKEQQASHSVSLEAEAAPLSAARPADPPQVSQEGTSHTPSIIILDRVTPLSPFQAQNQGTPKESTEQPSKRLHLQEPAPIDLENQVVGHEESTLQNSDPKNLLINFDTFTQAADQALASSSLGQEVGRLGLVGTYNALQQYVAHGFALARAVEKEFRFLESERQTWVDRGKKSEEEILRWSSTYFEVEEGKLVSAKESLKQAQETIAAHDHTIFQQGIDIVDQYELEFERALEQIRFLHPSMDVSEAGPFKEIVNGQLVSMETPPGSPFEMNQVDHIDRPLGLRSEVSPGPTVLIALSGF
ncbi:hypothetical protein CR513_30174, partial [Mucuna pruriens]